VILPFKPVSSIGRRGQTKSRRRRRPPVSVYHRPTFWGALRQKKKEEKKNPVPTVIKTIFPKIFLGDSSNKAHTRVPFPSKAAHPSLFLYNSITFT